MDHEAKPERRLAAIMATDVVGYSKLMQSDEAGALAALAAIRGGHAEADQTAPRSDCQHSRRQCSRGVRKRRGGCELRDGSPGKLSDDSRRRGLQVRIGIHIGDVVDKGETCSGRRLTLPLGLKALPSPGVSWCRLRCGTRSPESSQLRFDDLGLKTLKNIEQPLRAFALSSRTASVSPRRPCRRSSLITRASLPLPSCRSRT